MSTEETQAAVLAEWLDAAPGTPLPEDLDPEVLEAVLALRPDLAPAPRLVLDDLIVGLTAGPLAEGEVVPFPPAEAAEPADVAPVAKPANNTRWWAAAGTVTALAAAVMLTVLQTMSAGPEPALTQSASMPRAELSEEAPASTAPTDAPSEQAPAMDQTAEEVVAAAPPPPPPAPRAAPVIAEVAEAELDAVADVGDFEDDFDGADRLGEGGQVDGLLQTEASELMKMEPEPEPSSAPSTIRTRSSRSSASAPAAASSGASSAGGEVAQGGGSDDLTAAMAEARALARSGQPGAGAERLEHWVAPPASRGQAAALMAADLWLRASEPQRAVDIASLGLALGAGADRTDLLRTRAKAYDQLGNTAAAEQDRAEAGD